MRACFFLLLPLLMTIGSRRTKFSRMRGNSIVMIDRKKMRQILRPSGEPSRSRPKLNRPARPSFLVSKSVFANAELSSSSKRCVACLHTLITRRLPAIPWSLLRAHVDGRRQIDRAFIHVRRTSEVSYPIVRGSLSRNDARQKGRVRTSYLVTRHSRTVAEKTSSVF